jgi:hypothetical protein
MQHLTSGRWGLEQIACHADFHRSASELRKYSEFLDGQLVRSRTKSSGNETFVAVRHVPSAALMTMEIPTRTMMV